MSAVIDLESSSSEQDEKRQTKKPRTETSAVSRVVALLSQSADRMVSEAATLSETELQLLQASLVKMTDEPGAAKKSREVLPVVQRLLVRRKLEKMRAVQASDSARQEMITKKLEGESEDLFRVQVRRAGGPETKFVCKRIWGDNCDQLKKLDINFTTRIPFNQAAEKFSSPAYALAITNFADKQVAEFVEYFLSRARAGVATPPGHEICLLPPGPVARAIVGVETLNKDEGLGKLPVLLVLNK
jgi:hypothetical protein